MAERTVLITQQLLKPIKLLKWKVTEGSTMSIGRVILLYDFDGAAKKEQRKLKSTQAGTVHKLIAPEGAIIRPGETLLELKACIHPTVMKDMCAECGADLRKDDITTTASVPMIHAIPDLKVSEEQAQKIGKADGDRLLKDRKLVLLVDLDQTLIHTTNDIVPPNIKDVYHFQLYGHNSPWYHTRLRPGTHDFLKNISVLYELHICTFGARNYAHTIAMFLDNDESFFANRILSRDECFDPTSKKANLKALFPCGDDMVCIIDDREDVWNHAFNLIHVKPYHFFQHTGDINAPPGLDKHDNDDKGGVDLTNITKKSEKLNGKNENVSENGIEKNVSTSKDRKEKEESSKKEKNETTIDEKAVEKESIEDNKTPIEESQKSIEENDDMDVNNSKEENEKSTNDIVVTNSLAENEQSVNDNEIINSKEKKKLDDHKDIIINKEESEKSADDEIIDKKEQSVEHKDVINNKEESEKSADDEIIDKKEKSAEQEDIINNKEESEKSADDEIIDKKEKSSEQENIINNKEESEKSADDEIIDKKENEHKDVVNNKEQNEKSAEHEDVINNKEENHENVINSKENEKSVDVNDEINNKEENNVKEESDNIEKIENNRNSSELNEKKEEMIEIEDPDDYLAYLEDILKRIHKTFYEEYDKMEAGNVPDLKEVIPNVRSQILKGTKLVFSGLVPTHIKLEQSKAYQVARSLGAIVTQDLEEDTTHLVAVRPGTAKVNAGRRRKNLKIVTPDWLWCCAERWEHIDESIYPLNSKGSKNRHPPPHCSSPEHAANYPVHDTPGTRKRTPSGRFMDTINPLMSFSSDDIADMDKEVEDILDDESDESEEEAEPANSTTTSKEEPTDKKDDECSSSSSSEESLTAEYPRGYKRARENDDKTNDEDEYPSTKFRRGEKLDSDLDFDQDSNSDDGSTEAPDEVDDGEWNMMGAALEREFLSNN